jgi:hypothetical protein
MICSLEYDDAFKELNTKLGSALKELALKLMTLVGGQGGLLH